MALDGTRHVMPLVQSPFAERNGVVSPDGRWLAYEANDSGRFEIYVRPFPDVNSGHWHVSTIPGGNLGRTYDISPDGQRFLMIKEGAGSDQTAAPTSLIVCRTGASS